MKCRSCDHDVKDLFVDLNDAPPSNHYVKSENKDLSQVYFPLQVHVCANCMLVQMDEYENHEAIFNAEYAYFSSFSKTWLTHCKQYVDSITQQLHLKPNSNVVEIASNDGYLLQYFVEKGIPCYGVEPTASTAQAAREKGVDVVEEFFTESLAKQLSEQPADLIIANNVFAHVPDVKDFVRGLKTLLSNTGTVTIEFPHLLKLMQDKQFDTIYHEHFSYFSLIAVNNLIEPLGLCVYKVDEIPTHGGSLRIYLKHAEYLKDIEPSVQQVLEKEKAFGLDKIETYEGFQEEVDNIRDELLTFLIDAKKAGKKVAAYGAAAKGNTLLNYAGVHKDLLAFIVDANPHKQGMLSPGSKIPVVPMSHLVEEEPDIIMILPWNIQTEIEELLAKAVTWSASVWVAIPELTHVAHYAGHSRKYQNLAVS